MNRDMRIKTIFQMFLSLVMIGCVGCTEKKTEFRLTQRTPQEATIDALQSDDADARYKALVELSKNKKALVSDWSVKAMMIILRTDPSPSVRAQAAHNMGLIADGRVLSPLNEAISDPDPRVRLEASWSLAQCVPSAWDENPKLTSTIRGTLTDAVLKDSSTDVRINSAIVLGNFSNKNVLLTLITALKDTDFAVRYEAERSLIRLTGRTFHYNAVQWLAWLEETKNTFGDAGQTPPELAVPRQNMFEKTRDEIYRFYIEWQGPAKH
jgi:hypothetical protein